LTALSIAIAVGAGGTLYVEGQTAARTQAETMTGGHVRDGQTAMAHYGCGSCHTIAGISGANGTVGPDLKHIAGRTEIAGSLPNDPLTMQRWLMHPQALRPGSGMPEQAVTRQDARDMAAYLYTLK
jgi:cytochrome c1